MEFISQETDTVMLNYYVIASFINVYGTYMNKHMCKNVKWEKILGDFWETIKDVSLEKDNFDSWCKLGDLIETNLFKDWKNDIHDSCIIEIYSMQFHTPAKFQKYLLCFQENERLDEDSDEEREQKKEFNTRDR